MEIIDRIDDWAQRHWKLVTITLAIVMIVGLALTGGIE